MISNPLKRTWFLLTLLITFVIPSCTMYKEVEFLGQEGFKLKETTSEAIKADLGFRVSNPNWYAIKVKKADLDVSADGFYMGKLLLDKKVKIKRKSSEVVTVPLSFQLEKGALFKGMQLMNKEEVQLELKGLVKGGVWFISKKEQIQQNQQINLKELRNKSGM